MATGECFEMFIAQNALLGCEILFKQWYGPLWVSRFQVSLGEVVSGCQSLGVVVAGDPFPTRETLFQERGCGS